MNSRARAIPDRNSWLKATIVHAEAESVAMTDWRQIVALYDRLGEFSLRQLYSSIVPWQLRCAMGPEAGLTQIDAVLEHGELANYYLAHSACADMCRRLGRTAEARTSYAKGAGADPTGTRAPFSRDAAVFEITSLGQKTLIAAGV
jgi:predicted RNA polymerase sigma factor